MTTPKIKGYIETIGRRKTSTARVRVSEGKGVMTVNGKLAAVYFPTEELSRIVHEPMLKGKASATFDISAKIVGGGSHSQAEALRHGIARALVIFDEEMKGKMKSLGFLKRDPRAKERRKFGLKKARKSPQWSKR